MFDKLTTRERNLAYAVIGLLPAALIFIAIFWFSGKYDANLRQIESLNKSIADEVYKTALGKKADRRLAYYNSISLPPDLEDASNDYQFFMKQFVRDELKMDLKAFTPTDASDLKDKTELIGKRKYYMLRADGNLDQLTQFLSRFYSVDLLHRINSLKIIPQNETSGSDKKIRTGVLGVTAKIEVLALDTAIDYNELLRRFDTQRATESKLAETNESFRKMVLHRDIFGPPNNTPTLTATPKSSYPSETEAEVTITAKDADEEDLMNFEIVEAPIEGWKLDQSKPGDSSAVLKIPGQKAGRYSFTVKVTDNGFPAKESTKEFAVTFKDKEIVKPEPLPKPDPPFINAKETRITAIVLEKTGDWRVWINVRTQPDGFHKLKVGESFKLDDKDWIVESISPREAVIRVDNRLLTFRPTDAFINPYKEVILDVPAPEPKADSAGDASGVQIESDAAPKPRISASARKENAVLESAAIDRFPQP